MNTTLIPLVIFVLFFISFFQSILMLAANDYIYNSEIFTKNNRKNYFKFIKINFQKLLKTIIRKNESEISPILFLSNYIYMLLLFFPIAMTVLNKAEICFVEYGDFLRITEGYYLIYTLFITFTLRITCYIGNNIEIDFNKLFLKGVVSISLILLNIGFMTYFSSGLDAFGSFKILIKIILFLNVVLSVYVFDNHTKFKNKNSSYGRKLLDKVALYFLLFGCFLILNSDNDSAGVVKYFYYTTSIFLIEFVASYASKLMGNIKLHQAIKISFEYILTYYIIFYLALMVSTYVL